MKHLYRRNLPWLLALIPALAVTTLAASQRMITLYLPWEFTRPAPASGAEALLEQDFAVDDQVFHRSVTVRLLGIAPVAEFEDAAAADGAQLWRVDLAFRAGADQLLAGCQLTLHAAGVTYSPAPAKVAAPGTSGSWRVDNCVPAETPGPTIDYFGGLEIVEETPRRPTAWELSTSFALPQGVTPEEVRVGWDPPDYVTLPVAGS